jgi:hypothetical protein
MENPTPQPKTTRSNGLKHSKLDLIRLCLEGNKRLRINVAVLRQFYEIRWLARFAGDAG